MKHGECQAVINCAILIFVLFRAFTGYAVQGVSFYETKLVEKEIK